MQCQVDVIHRPLWRGPQPHRAPLATELAQHVVVEIFDIVHVGGLLLGNCLHCAESNWRIESTTSCGLKPTSKRILPDLRSGLFAGQESLERASQYRLHLDEFHQLPW